MATRTSFYFLLIFATGGVALAQPLQLRYGTFLGGSDGDSISAVATDPQGNAYVAGFTTSLDFPATYDLSVGRQVERSADAGISWEPTSDLPGVQIRALAVTHSEPPVVYAGGVNAVYRSDDGGASWKSTNFPVEDPASVFPPQASTLYLAVSMLAVTNNPDILYVASLGHGFLRTQDGGDTWVEISEGLPIDQFGRRDFHRIAADPFRPLRIWAAVNGGLFQSDDAGESWRPVFVPDIGNVRHVAFAPGADGTIYVFSQSRLVRSTDGGESWTAGGDLPSAGIVRTPFLFRVSPSNADVIYAEFGSQQAVLWRSLDGGSTWSEGVPLSETDSFVADLAVHPSEPETLLATDFSATYRSTDAGESWRQVRETGGQVATLPDGLAIAASEREADAFIAKVSQSGDRLFFATLLGGGSGESIADIAVDGAGQVTAIGRTGSSDFPITHGSLKFDDSNQAGPFIVRLNADGDKLEYSTGLPSGNELTLAETLTMDAAGNAYVAGQTGSDFPTTPDAAQTAIPSSNEYDVNAFAVKLNTSGNVVYATLIGGSNIDRAAAIAVDAEGAAWVAGQTRSGDFSTTDGGSTLSGFEDAFLLKLNPSGTAFSFATYLGGARSDGAGALAIDKDGAIYVTGHTEGDGFPTTEGAYQSALRAETCTYSLGCAPGCIGPSFGIAPAADVFVTKFTPDGEVVYSTLIGGECRVGPNDLVVDAGGQAQFVGATLSKDFPLVSPIQSRGGCGFFNPVIAKLNADGSDLVFSSYLDASEASLAAGPEGETWVGGGSCSQSTVTPDAVQTTADGSGGGYLARLGPVPESTLNLQSVSNAFGGPEGEISPGGLIELRGESIGPDRFLDLGLKPVGALPNEVKDTRVLIHDLPAPLMIASPNRLVVAAPTEIAGVPAVLVRVERGDERSNQLSVRVFRVSPSLLTLDSSGTGQLNARNSDGTLNTPENPASRGSLVTLYATGLGLTEPAQASGAIASTNQVRPTDPIAVLIGNATARILSVGSMPGFVNGLFQVWVRIPEEVEPGIVGVELLSPSRAGGWTLAIK